MSPATVHARVFAALSALFIAASAGAKPGSDTAALIDAVVLDEMAKQNIVGMSVGIVRNGQIYYARGYGHADLARTIPITTDTLFRWGSVSKTLTAAAALKLTEVNPGFRLDDRVTDHVDYWPDDGGKGDIRIWHLLANRSGIIHYRKKKHCPGNPSPAYARHRHTSRLHDARQAVAVFSDQALCFAPGSHFKYSTFGYSLLGSAIEGGAGQSYADWINDAIRIPLGMASLRQATGERTGFTQRCHVLQDVIAGNAAWKLPGGGWESSIIDLAQFANALLQDSLLRQTSRLWTYVDENPSYGFGVKYTPDRRRVWHEGKHDNSRTLLYLYPDSYDQLGIVLMINGLNSKPRRIAHHLADLFGRTHDDDTSPLVNACESDCDGSFSGLWHRTGRDVLLRRGYSHENFLAESQFLHTAGYYTDDFEPYVHDGRVHWDAVFRKGPGENPMVHTKDYAQFENAWRRLSEKGYRLADLETYRIDNERRWAGLFRPGTGRQKLRAGLTSGQLEAHKNQLARHGHGLIDIEPYTDNARLLWAGVWVAGADGLLDYNLDGETFARLHGEHLKAGHRLSDIERYRHRGRDYRAVLWDKRKADQKWSSDEAFCGKKSASGSWIRAGIANRHNEWRKQGYELIDWERD